MYINFNLLRDFSEKITFDDIWEDILGNHLLTNLVCYGEDGDDEGGIETITYFIEQIDNDYQHGMANYKAYITKGMDARLFAQLRMNALLTYNKYFFDEYEQCKNLEDAKNLRIKHLRKKCEEYDDEPWQYYYLIGYLYGKNFPYNFMFDFECFFADCDYSKFTQVENYREDFIRAHLRGVDVIW